MNVLEDRTSALWGAESFFRQGDRSNTDLVGAHLKSLFAIALHGPLDEVYSRAVRVLKTLNMVVGRSLDTHSADEARAFMQDPR